MNDFGNGAIKSTYDLRDNWFKPVGGGVTNWDFDIEQVIGTQLVTKAQGSSSSCGGQAFAYYGEVLEAIATGTYDPQSARWPYSQCYVPGGGSAGRTLCNFLVKNGYVREVDATSYLDGQPPTEQFMEKIPVISDNADTIRDVSRAATYMQVKPNFDLIGQAVQQNNGCVILIGAANNGTWLSQFPAIPIGAEQWWHFLYVGKLKIVNGKRYLGVKNSWGDSTGDHGWQWLSEDWVAHILEVWTLSWNYQIAKNKQIMQAEIPLLQKVIKLLNQLLNQVHPSQLVNTQNAVTTPTTL